MYIFYKKNCENGLQKLKSYRNTAESFTSSGSVFSTELEFCRNTAESFTSSRVNKNSIIEFFQGPPPPLSEIKLTGLPLQCHNEN